jgi:hypothetical protein
MNSTTELDDEQRSCCAHIVDQIRNLLMLEQPFCLVELALIFLVFVQPTILTDLNPEISVL